MDVKKWREQQGFQGSQYFQGHSDRRTDVSSDWPTWHTATHKDAFTRDATQAALLSDFRGSDSYYGGDEGGYHAFSASYDYGSQRAGTDPMGGDAYDPGSPFGGTSGGFSPSYDAAYQMGAAGFTTSYEHGSNAAGGSWDFMPAGTSQDIPPPEAQSQSQFDFFGGSPSQFHTPLPSHTEQQLPSHTPLVQGFVEFRSKGNPWASVSSPSPLVQEQHDVVQRRQQPPRDAKNRGRTCLTGTHIPGQGHE